MADKTYVVTAAAAVVYNTDHSAAVTLARGAAVPPGSDPEHLQLLVDRGIIEEGEATGGLDSPEDEPPFPAVEEKSSRRSGKADES